MDLGQHLLVDEAVIARVMKAAKLQPTDRVLDAGAGQGALTRPISKVAGKVFAVDVDPAMIGHLQEQNLPNVSVHEGNLLEWPLPELDVVVANPPFKIAAPVMERLLHVPRAVYVVPRELADRLLAEPGSDNYGKLTIRVAIRAKVEDHGFVGRRAFDPAPNVTCGIISLRTKDVPSVDAEMLDAVLDAAWANWNRKARHAFSSLAPKFRTDGAALAALVKATGFSEKKTNELPPYVFAEVARHLTAAR